MSYDLIVTAVRDRADLLDRTLRSLLASLDAKPSRILVHEDVRPSVECPAEPTTRALLDAIADDFAVPVVLFERNPGGGLGRAVLRLLEESSTEFVLYTQEDFDALRAIPVAACLDLMAAHQINHVRFNKRKTMKVKGADRPPGERFTKIEQAFGEQTLCVSDNWYFQTSLWRRELALDGFRAVAERNGPGMIDRCEMKFQRWLHEGLGRGIGCTDSTGAERRGEVVKTFIWGPTLEPAFIRHTGHDRRSQGWPDPEKRNRDS